MLFLSVIIAFMPSKIKIACYRIMGVKIGRNSYIGFSILNAKNAELGDCVYIGHFNLLWRLKTLKLGSGSRISLFNWVTGGRDGSFILGRNSSISFGHYIEASSDITIGSNCIVAGRSSQFFSHGITPDDLDDRRPITIGDWCYIGSAVRFVPGACISHHSFVGMGAVVAKEFIESYVLIAGNPATIKKNLSPEATFFARQYIPHAHHGSVHHG